MSDQEDQKAASELSADDLDIVVGGASVESAEFIKSEESVKLLDKGEQRRKHMSSEDKIKRD